MYFCEMVATEFHPDAILLVKQGGGRNSGATRQKGSAKMQSASSHFPVANRRRFGVIQRRKLYPLKGQGVLR